MKRGINWFKIKQRFDAKYLKPDKKIHICEKLDQL